MVDRATDALRAAQDAIDTADDLLTVADVVLRSGFSEDTVRRHIKKGALPVVRIGPYRRVRVRRADFVVYMRPA